jgi:hypothetical protein
MRARGTKVAGTGLALGLWVLILAGPGGADDKEEPEPKEVRPTILKMADALAKDKASDVKKEAEVLRKFKLKFTMRLLKLRTSKGLGIGPKAGLVRKEEDGIERKVDVLADVELTKAQLAKEGTALEAAGFRLAAIATVAQAWAPDKDDPKDEKKKVKTWKDNADLLREAALQLADAVRANNGPGIKKAAILAQKSCVECHRAFRPDDD